MTETTASSAVEPQRGSAGEVFLVALRLGLTSFGGPIAHLGYFERTYVRERQWLTPDEYGGLVAERFIELDDRRGQNRRAEGSTPATQPVIADDLD